MSDTVTDSDLQLLARYTRDRAEDAFAEIVRRHLDLVHSAALRQVRSPQLAEEVAQSVFTDLARNAAKFKPDTIVTAWLYQVTRRTAIDVVRREARRQLREQIATEMNAMNATATDWTHIEPLLDEAMHALDDTDRAAVLLRYFENKSLREVGATLGTSDDAAQKRVSRAVEHLREFFAKRGITVGASGLVVVISANAVQAAPVGLAVTISTAAAFAGTTIVATTIATHTTMNWINIKSITALAAAAVAAGTGTHLLQQREANRLRSENQNLIAQQEQLTTERDTALSTAANKDELERLRKDQSELLRLRGEVGTLRRQSKELEKLRDENRQLRSSLAETTKASPPKEADPDADPQKQAAIAKLNDARVLLLGLILYASDNQNQLPADFNQNSNYWANANPRLTGTNQFELVIQGSLSSITNPSMTIAVREKDAWFAKGKWFKTYGFADGHSEVHTEADGNFEAWEKQRMLIPPDR